jgi:activator of HSP90 ATPase
MKTNSYSVSAVIAASPEQVYTAWMSGKEHGAMTGGAAKVSPKVGGKFSAWDGYILGTTLELVPFKRIVQAWRTTEFPEDSPDSRLLIELAPARSGTRITITHSDIPPGQGQEYKKGWVDFYFKPMKEYFKAKR